MMQVAIMLKNRGLAEHIRPGEAAKTMFKVVLSMHPTQIVDMIVNYNELSERRRSDTDT